MSCEAWRVAALCVSIGCRQGSVAGSGTAAAAPHREAATTDVAEPAAPRTAVRDARGATDAALPVAAGSTESPGATHYEGTAEGRAVDPPIREFVRNFAIEPWTGQGTLALRVAPADGAVDGTLVFGALRFVLRGVRSGAHVRAALEQEVARSAVPDAGLAVDPFVGTLDGDIEPTGVRGRWELSAQAGYHRRSGTFGARAR